MAQTTNSVQTIKDYFTAHNGLQLQNRFYLRFFNVPSYGGGNTNIPDLHAQEISIAPRNLETISDGLQGYGAGRSVTRNQKLLSDNSGLLVTFPLTNDSFILDFFNRWFNYFYASWFASGIANNRRTFMLPFYDDAVRSTRMELRVLDPNGNVNTNIVFTEVFPIETQPLVFTMRNESSFATYTVAFGYRDYSYQIF